MLSSLGFFGVVDGTLITFDFDCDGTNFHIFDGSLLEGPATTNLYQYRVSFNPDNNQLHVYN